MFVLLDFAGPRDAGPARNCPGEGLVKDQNATSAAETLGW